MTLQADLRTESGEKLGTRDRQRRGRIAAMSLSALVVTASSSLASGAWIEALPAGAWNASGAAIPQAPAGENAEMLARCTDQVRQPDDGGERALQGAGWRLFGPALRFGETRTVWAFADVDGMCRPLRYQVFVLVGDGFAGTLSPALMDSRTDGALDRVEWLDESSITASFRRYDADDPLCCPSARSTVVYSIERGAGGVTVTPLSGTTEQLPQPEPEAPPPPVWTGSIGAGLSVTSGNTDTSSYNLAFSVVRDPKRRYLFKADGLYLQSDQDGEQTADKTSLQARGERSFSDRLFGFVELGYLSDRFKDIDYLYSPLVGVGWRVILPEPVSFELDAGVGGAIEKDDDLPSTSDAAFKFGERLRWAISKRATVTQSVTGLWKLDDTEDAFYHFELGISSGLTSRSELKLSYLVAYDNLPTSPDLDKTDTAILATVVMKF